MPAMPPAGAPAQAASAPAKEPGQASQVFAQIGDLMDQGLQMMQGKLPDQDVQQFQGIVQAYQQFVEKVLGSSGEEQSEGEPAAKGAVPPEAGAADVKPAY